MHPSSTKIPYLGGTADSPHTEMEDDPLFHTPPPVAQETQTQQETREEAPLFGRGQREHHDIDRLSPSGPRPRPRKAATRYRKHAYRCLKLLSTYETCFYLCKRHLCTINVIL